MESFNHLDRSNKYRKSIKNQEKILINFYKLIINKKKFVVNMFVYISYFSMILMI